MLSAVEAADSGQIIPRHCPRLGIRPVKLRHLPAQCERRSRVGVRGGLRGRVLRGIDDRIDQGGQRVRRRARPLAGTSCGGHYEPSVGRCNRSAAREPGWIRRCDIATPKIARVDPLGPQIACRAAMLCPIAEPAPYAQLSDADAIGRDGGCQGRSPEQRQQPTAVGPAASVPCRRGVLAHGH